MALIGHRGAQLPLPIGTRPTGPTHLNHRGMPLLKATGIGPPPRHPLGMPPLKATGTAPGPRRRTQVSQAGTAQIALPQTTPPTGGQCRALPPLPIGTRPTGPTHLSHHGI